MDDNKLQNTSENQNYVVSSSENIRNIVIDIILTIITLGLWNLWVQHRQMVAVNEMIQKQRYSFLPWFLFTLITCGLYHIYHEWRMSQDISELLGAKAVNLPLITLVLSLFALPIVADAIQQSFINRFYGDHNL